MKMLEKRVKTQPPLTHATIVLPSYAGLLAGIKKFVFILVEMWIVVCLTAPVMLPSS